MKVQSFLPVSPPADPVALDETTRAAIVRQVTRRIVPFLFFLYMIAYLDRVNVGFAKSEMQKSLPFGDPVYGTGMGMFFIGYFFFEVPSNLLLEKIGARLWIARIMFTWGLVAAAMLFTRSVTSFYVLRFLLGLAEAGFFPGVILYLTYWFTRAERGRIIAMFMTANMAANIIGGPVSEALMKVHGHGLAGWQWLFLLEGLPAVLVAFVVLAYLPNGPADARWLTPQARAWLVQRQHDENAVHADHRQSLMAALGNPRVWHVSLLFLTMVIGMYGFALWLPSLVKAYGGNYKTYAGWITALPYTVTALGMVLIGAHSDKYKERRLHVTFSALVGSLGLFGAAMLVGNPVLCLLSLTVAAVGMWSCLGPFWTLATNFLAGTAAAGAIAFINSIGNLGGYLGPSIVGKLNPAQLGYRPGLLFLSSALLVSSLLAFTTRRES